VSSVAIDKEHVGSDQSTGLRSGDCVEEVWKRQFLFTRFWVAILASGEEVSSGLGILSDEGGHETELFGRVEVKNRMFAI
jgi:hypothetical protein